MATSLSHAVVEHTITKRRRCVALSVLQLPQIIRRSRPRAEAIPRPIFCFSTNVQGLSDTAFNRMYRLKKETFFKLADRITITRHRYGATSSKSSPLLRLSMNLRWLAGGSYLDITSGHGVAPSFYFHVNQTIQEIDKTLEIRFPYRDETWLKSASNGFSREGHSSLSGCCAALDGLAVKIIEPSRKEVGNTFTYYNRKGFFAINLQAACDDKYRFLFVSGLAVHSTHDSTAFAMSSLARLLQNREGGVLIGCWIACDDAYAASYNMITPWPGRRLPKEKDCFNYWLSSARIHIEQAFGLLVARWGILWRTLRLKVAASAHLLIVLCKLHNYILGETNFLDVPPPSNIDSASHTVPADYNVRLQDECDTDDLLHRRRRDLETCDIRKMFTEEIKDAGLRHPTVY